METATVTFSDVELPLYKWAHKFCNKYYSFWDLINGAWAYGGISRLPKSKVKCASNRARQDMIDYMRRPFRYRKLPIIKTFTDFNKGKEERNSGIEKSIADINRESEFESRESFEYLLRGLSKEEKLVMRLIYWHGWTGREISKAINIHPTRVVQYHAQALKRLREVNGVSEVC